MDENEPSVWPEGNVNCPRRMSFLSGEPRWYLWLQDENKQAILALRRNLLLLHQNGDLRILKEKKLPATGTYITALYDGKMIRGCICPTQDSSENGMQSTKTIRIIDIDEGRMLQLPLNQLRLLPSEMKRLPCQAVRCDVGLDCLEQFDWSTDINKMLSKALSRVILFVEIISKQPGSIPTIAAKITICDPASGQSISIQKWLVDVFSSHLDLCSLEKYRPFPVGMSPDQMANAMQIQSPQMFGVNNQGLPPRLSMSMSPGVLTPPGLPSPPGYLSALQAITVLSQQQVLPSAGFMPHGFPPSPSSSISEVKSYTSVAHTPQSLSGRDSMVETSPRSASRSSSIREVKPSTSVSHTPQSLSGHASMVETSPSSALQSECVYDSDISQSSAATLDLDVRLVTSGTETSSSSSLRVDAPSFVPQPKKKDNLRIDAPEFSPKVNINKSSKESQSRIGSSTNSRHSQKRDIESSSKTDPDLSQSASSLACNPIKTSYPRGKHVELVHIVQDWKVGQVIPAIIARVWTPSCIEVNVVDENCELLTRVQEEIKNYYKSNKIKMSSKQQVAELCGNFCACYDTKEDIWFRAELDKLSMDDLPIKVWAVDVGGFSRVECRNIQPLCTHLACTAPILITICSMRNIKPRSTDGVWPEQHLTRVNKLLPEEKLFYLRIDGEKSKEHIWPVSIFTDPDCSLQSINETLVSERCAYYLGVPTTEKRQQSAVNEVFDEDPMEEAYEIGGNNYEVDDEDACVAVSGRKPTDESGICWFFHKNGYCYKKICELKHVRLDPDGHSIEKVEMHISSFEDIQESVLVPGEKVWLTVTRIFTVTHFYATINFEKVAGKSRINSRETLSSLLKNLNSKEMKRSLTTFTEYPADGEIVLFKDPKTDMFYRGRVIGSDPNDDNIFHVLNVDSGHQKRILFRDLRRADPAFLHHPFQAIECWLANVEPTQSDHEWAKTCNTVFADLVKGQQLLATIVRSVPWGVEINLLNNNGQDITSMLMELSIVKSSPMRHLPIPESKHLPG